MAADRLACNLIGRDSGRGCGQFISSESGPSPLRCKQIRENRVEGKSELLCDFFIMCYADEEREKCL